MDEIVQYNLKLSVVLINQKSINNKPVVVGWGKIDASQVNNY